MIKNYEIVLINRTEENRKETLYFDDCIYFNWRLQHLLSEMDYYDILKKISEINNRFNFNIKLRLVFNYRADTIKSIDIYAIKIK